MSAGPDGNDQSYTAPPAPRDGHDWPTPTATAYPMKPTDTIDADGQLWSGARGAIKAIQHEHRVVVRWTGDRWEVARPRLQPPPSPIPTAADLFDPEPDTWGLRGDPYLWEDMQNQLQSVPFPSSVTDAQQLIRGLFRDLVGHDVDDNLPDDMVFISRYAHGGMSSGHIHLATWRDELIPLLLSRVDPR